MAQVNAPVLYSTMWLDNVARQCGSTLRVVSSASATDAERRATLLPESHTPKRDRPKFSHPGLVVEIPLHRRTQAIGKLYRG